MPLDLDGDMIAVRIHRHDIHRADSRRVFAPHQLRALADALDLLGQVALQMVLDAVLDQARVDAQLVRRDMGHGRSLPKGARGHQITLTEVATCAPGGTQAVNQIVGRVYMLHGCRQRFWFKHIPLNYLYLM